MTLAFKIKFALLYILLIAAAFYITLYCVKRQNAAKKNTHSDYWMIYEPTIVGVFHNICSFRETYRAFRFSSLSRWQKTRLALGFRLWLPKGWS